LLASYYVNCLPDFTKYVTLVQSGTKLNQLYFEVKRSKVKFTARLDVLLWQRRTDRWLDVEDCLLTGGKSTIKDYY